MLKLSVIMPVYNEKETFPEILPRVQAVEVHKEIIIIDNVSTDGTREMVKAAEGGNVRVFLQPRNLGKGGSVRRGIQMACGEYTIIQDADLEYDPADYLRLLEAAETEEAEAVFGSRVLGRPPGALPTSLQSLGRFGINLLFRLLYMRPITDAATCYKLVRTDVLKSLRLTCSGFDLDFEIAAKIVKHGGRIVEVPVSYTPRSVAEGKKIRYTDGFASAWCMIKTRFVG